MKKTVMRGLFAAALLSAAALPMRAWAGDWPLAVGDFWEVTDVHLKDGGEFAYAKFLAGEWRAEREFAKSKGWIKGYVILSNNNPRKGEADLYLITITDHLASGPEAEKRNDEYVAWAKKTNEQMVKESGNRVEIREILGSELLQELKFK
ncbi:MAG: hypothetical protein JO224_06025 [Pelomonas sp.]|nr:hypothetical protein [Roseateles sp.]